MKKIINKIKSSEFFVAIGSTGFTSILQIFSGIIINKIIAVKIGPSGIALLGQFLNFRDMMTTFGTGSFGQGVTKYIADKDYEEKNVVSTSLIFSFVISIFIGILILLSSKFLSLKLLKSVEYFFIFYIFSFTIIFFSLNNLLISIVNGKRNYLLLAKMKVANSVVSLIVSGLLCWYFGLKGALIALATNTSIVFFVSIYIYSRQKGLKINFSINYWQKKLLIKLLGFTIMALTSSILKPTVELIIRNYIIEYSSEFNAGLWESMKQLSRYYMQIFTMALGVYYLPKLASLKTNEEIKSEVFLGIKRIVPLFLISASILFLFRTTIINVLFDTKFLEMNVLFLPQLVGDLFMIISFMLAYLMLARAMVKEYIIIQFIMSTIRISLSIYFFQYIGIRGIIWANAVVYLIYTLILLVLFRRILFK